MTLHALVLGKLTEAEGEVTPLFSRRGKLLHSDRDRLRLTKRVVVLPLTSSNTRREDFVYAHYKEVVRHRWTRLMPYS